MSHEWEGPPVRFSAGGGTAVVSSSFVALVDAPVESKISRCLIELVSETSSFDAVLSELASLGFGQLPSFAVLTLVDGSLRLVVRGTAEVTTISANGDRATFDGRGMTSWVEHSSSEIVDFVAALAGASESALLFGAWSGGVFPAVALASDGFSSAVDNGPETADPFATTAPHGDTEIAEDQQTVSVDSAPSGSPGQGEVAATVVDLDEPDREARTDVVAASATPIPLATEGAHDAGSDDVPLAGATLVAPLEPELPADVSIAVIGDARPPDARSVYDDLIDPDFSATMLPIDRAAIRAEDDHEVEADPAQPETSQSLDLDQAERTYTIEELRRLRSGADGPSPSSPPLAAPSADGPFVLSTMCRSGHANPPISPICRTCGELVPTQDPAPVPAPLIGVLRFSHGLEVPVRRTVLIGRSPKSSGGRLADEPDLVEVPSDDHDISRTHVELSVSGWQVVVSDLGSTNGTVVRVPNRSAQRLRPNEPCVITLGTEVSLADEISFTFEAV